MVAMSSTISTSHGADRSVLAGDRVGTASEAASSLIAQFQFRLKSLTELLEESFHFR